MRNVTIVAVIFATCLAFFGCMQQQTVRPGLGGANNVTDTSVNNYISDHIIPDGLSDASLVTIGMKYEDVIKALPADSYSIAGTSLYLNDEVTGHIYEVKFRLQGYSVESVSDTGIDVDYIAPIDALDQIEKGMSLNEIVKILGRPLYMPTSGVITMVWRIGDSKTRVLLHFCDGELMIFDGRYSVSSL